MNQRISGFGGRGWRTGAMDDKKVFIIICGIAIAVAAVAIGRFVIMTGGGGSGKTDNWQCLKCGYSFFDATIMDPSPIDCPKCSGQAVKLGYRTCAECREKVLVSRSRLRADAAARFRELKAQGKAPMPMEMQGWPREIQLRVKQPDGEYGWTEWMSTTVPEVRDIQSEMKCSKCDAWLYPHFRTRLGKD